MNQRLINEKRKQVLLDPSRESIDSLILVLKDSKPGAHDRDIAFFNSLQPQTGAIESGYTSIGVISQKTINKPKLAKRQVSSDASPRPALATLKAPASAQWSFVNGLGDMEWIHGQCVRRCLEDRVVHAQALPRPKTFEVSITGRFNQAPSAEVSTPFHRINYTVEAVGSIEKEEWTCHRYQCQLVSADDEYEQKDMLFESLFSVSSGDYILELVYSF